LEDYRARKLIYHKIDQYWKSKQKLSLRKEGKNSSFKSFKINEYQEGKRRRICNFITKIAYNSNQLKI
jgi:hypothetical protein